MCDDHKCFSDPISLEFVRDLQAIRDHAERHGYDKTAVSTSDGRAVLLTFIPDATSEVE